MERDREWQELLNDIHLRRAPLNTEQKLRRNIQDNQRRRRWLVAGSVSLASLLALFIGFVVMVNTSVVFARTVHDIAGLSRLARALTYRPSMKAAVENRYVQLIGQTLSQDDVELTVEYVIADEKSLSLFYTAKYTKQPDLEFWSTGILYDHEGEEIPVSGQGGGPLHEARSYFWGDWNDSLASCDFMLLHDQKETIPLSAKVELSLCAAYVPEAETDNYPKPTFAIELELDPELTLAGRTQGISQWLEMEGQRIYLDKLVCYPTSATLFMEAHPDNTAILESISLRMENEYGEAFERVSNGIVSLGSPSGDISQLMMESSFFSRSLTMSKISIHGAAFRPKEQKLLEVDAHQGTVQNWPEDLVLLQLSVGAVVIDRGDERPFEMPGEAHDLTFVIGKDSVQTNDRLSLGDVWDADGSIIEMEGEDWINWYLTGDPELQGLGYRGLAAYDSPLSIELLWAPYREFEPIVLELVR